MLKQIITYLLLILCSSFTSTCLLSIILAETGYYSSSLTPVVFSVIFVLYSILLKKQFTFIETDEIPILHVFFLGAILLISIFLYWPPSEYILGGWDPGVYLATSSAIVKSGSINFTDKLLHTLNSEERGVFLSSGFGLFEFFPGLRLLNPPDGSIVSPQFFHMYPVLLSMIYYFFGIQGALCINPLIGLFCIIAIYALCYPLVGPRYALLGPVFLFANPLQIWMVRFQDSEMLTQLCYLLGFTFYFFAFPPSTSLSITREASSRNVIYVLISALCFWTASLTRYDFLLVVTPLLASGIISLSWNAQEPRFRKSRVLWTFLIFLGIVHAFAHQKLIAYLYRALLNLFEIGALISISSSILIALLIWFMKDRIERLWKIGLKPIRWFFALGILLTALYFLFYRVHQVNLGWERFNFHNLASFVSWPVMILALFGIVLTLLRSDHFEETVFVLIGLFVTFAVLLNKHIDAFYPWGARRFIPVAVPLIIIYAVKGTKSLGTWINSLTEKVSIRSFSPDLVQSAWIIIIAIAYIFTSQPSRAELLGYRDYSGMTNFFKQMTHEFPKADLIVTQERGVAEVLHFHFDLPAVYLRNPNPEKLNKLQVILKKRLMKGQKVFILTQNKPMFESLPDLHLELLKTYTWRGKCINDSRNGFPKGYRERGFDLMLLEVHL